MECNRTFWQDEANPSFSGVTLGFLHGKVREPNHDELRRFAF